MNNIDITHCILQHLDTTEIIKCSSINKLFYKVANNPCIWTEKLNHDFGNYGIFTISEQNYHMHKLIYKKYYSIYIQNTYNKKIICSNNTVSYLPIPKISFDEYVTKEYNLYWDIQKMRIQCTIDSKNYAGIGNIKLQLVTNEQLICSAVDLIAVIQLITSTRKLTWDNMDLMIMQKLNLIKISETFCEKNDLWHYEIKLQFNAVENWFPTFGNSAVDNAIGNTMTTKFNTSFVPNILLCNVGVLVDHIPFDNEKINLFKEMCDNSTFYNCLINISQLHVVQIQISPTSERIDQNINIRATRLFAGIVFYLQDIDHIRFLPPNNIRTKPFTFDEIKITINEEIITMQQKEIFQLESGIYYVPMMLKSGKQILENMIIPVPTKWSYKSITLNITNIVWDNDGTPTFIRYVPLCYYHCMFFYGKILSEFSY